MNNFCGECGTPIQEQQQFCHECGAVNSWSADSNFVPDPVSASESEIPPALQVQPRQEDASNDPPAFQRQPAQPAQFQTQGNQRKRILKWSITSIMISLVSAILITVPLLLNEYEYRFVSSVIDQINITVWLSDSALTEEGQLGEEATAFRQMLIKTPSVSEVYFVDKNEARERFTHMMADSPELLEGIDWDNNPLPASLEVEVEDPQKIATIVEIIRVSEQFPLITDDPDRAISYGQEILYSLLSSTQQPTRLLRPLILALGILTGIIALLFIGNTVRMAIASRCKNRNAWVEQHN